MKKIAQSISMRVLSWFDTNFSSTLHKKFKADERETYESELSSQRVNTMKYSSKSEFEPNNDLVEQFLSWSFYQMFSLRKFCWNKSNT